MKKEMTREELINFIKTNNGFDEKTLEQFSTEDLQKAYDSGQGAYIYLNALKMVSDNLNKKKV